MSIRRPALPDLSTTTGKLVASLGVAAVAAGVAGLGTFGSFSSTTSASTAVDSGTVAIALGSPGTAANRLTVGASGLVPGDTIQRAVTLSNTGTQNLGSLTLSSAATTTSKLDTDPAMGLQVRIDSCSTPWTETGAAPAYTYTCGGTTGTVLTDRPVIATNTALNAPAALTAGSTSHLRVTLTLPTAADNTLQGQSSVIRFTLTGTQRDATTK